jgi:hypothetical protein
MLDSGAYTRCAGLKHVILHGFFQRFCIGCAPAESLQKQPVVPNLPHDDPGIHYEPAALLASVAILPAPLRPPRRAVDSTTEHRVADAIIEAFPDDPQPGTTVYGVTP